VQETDHEGPSRRPARCGFEVCKGIFGRVAAFLGDGEDRDEDSNDAGEGPEDGKGLLEEQ
jgi:hypothetical protein